MGLGIPRPKEAILGEHFFTHLQPGIAIGLGELHRLIILQLPWPPIIMGDVEQGLAHARLQAYMHDLQSGLFIYY